MDLAALVTSFATGTYTVTRKARGTTTHGRVNTGTTTTVTITASVSPASGADIQRLLQGRQVNEARTVFTTTQLYVGGTGASYEADRVSIDGATWEVSHVETWRHSTTGAVVYRCLVTDTV